MGSFLRTNQIEHTAESVVVAVGELVVDKNGVGSVFILQLLRNCGYLAFRDLHARPPIPLEARRLAQAA